MTGNQRLVVARLDNVRNNRVRSVGVNLPSVSEA